MPKKINNPDYKELEIEPFESFMRSKVGKIITLNDLDNFNKIIETNNKKINISEFVYSYGQSSTIAVDAIKNILKDKSLMK